MHMKFETENPNQTPETRLSPESEKSNMATRRSFWKWRQCKSIDFYPYTQRLCYWTLELIFKAKLTVEFGNQNILNGHQAAILEVTSLKINRLLPIATINMCMKFEIEIPQQIDLCSANHVVCRRTDGQTDRRTRWIRCTPLQLQRLSALLLLHLHSRLYTLLQHTAYITMAGLWRII